MSMLREMAPKRTKPPKAKNKAAVELGRLGGMKKVPKGFAVLTKKQRSAMAKKGAAKRWGRKS